MKSFSEAYKYLSETSANNIAIRNAIFGAYINTYLQKNLAHDYILDMVTALYGPFNFSFSNDQHIMDMLQFINYGYCNNWIESIQVWAHQSIYGYQFEDFIRILKLLFNGKGDEILKIFNHICQVVRPDEMQYFPEMFPFGRQTIKNPWPRI